MPKTRHIVKEVSVSIATVSRVVKNVPGVSAAAFPAVTRAGYVPAVGRRSTSNLALLYPANYDPQ
jgi:DNA-binding LacI/PurR family transcriptional regulator